MLSCEPMNGPVPCLAFVVESVEFVQADVVERLTRLNESQLVEHDCSNVVVD